MKWQMKAGTQSVALIYNAAFITWTLRKRVPDTLRAWKKRGERKERKEEIAQKKRPSGPLRRDLSSPCLVFARLFLFLLAYVCFALSDGILRLCLILTYWHCGIRCSHHVSVLLPIQSLPCPLLFWLGDRPFLGYLAVSCPCLSLFIFHSFICDHEAFIKHDIFSFCWIHFVVPRVCHCFSSLYPPPCPSLHFFLLLPSLFTILSATRIAHCPSSFFPVIIYAELYQAAVHAGREQLARSHGCDHVCHG